MSPRAPKHCATAGCLGAAVRAKSHCATHQPAPWVGSPGSADLGNRRWRITRTAVLNRDGGRCRIRHPDRCVGLATRVDHL